MLRAQSWEEAVARRIPRDSPRFKGGLVRLIDSPEGTHPAPQAQVAEQAPGWVLATHFHKEYQFQLISAGWGTIGRNEVAPMTVQYTSPESGYGPTVAGPEGLSYYTLRPTAPAGAWYLPESRELMHKGLKKQQAVSGLIGTDSPEVLRGRREVAIEECIAMDSEGMAVWKVGVPPAGEVAASVLPGTGARYYLVAAGEMVVDGKRLEKGSIVFVHDEPGFMVRAGAVGLDAVVMQYPPQATAPLAAHLHSP